MGGIALDQISKYLAVLFLKGGGTVNVIPYLIDFIYVENPGAAFGSMTNQRWLFMVMSTVAIIGIAAYLSVARPKSPLLHYSLLMIMTGGIGNMIDRIALKYVVDFIDFAFFDFPTFNVADCYVTIGSCVMVLWMILDIIRDEKAKHTARAEEKDTNDREKN